MWRRSIFYTARFARSSNAIKFTATGRVALRVQPAVARGVGWLRFEVEDSGIGIEPQQKDRIFERFTQADESITRRFGGTGLGLAICRKLVEGMGGVLDVDSTPGAGSRFWFEVPLQACSARAAGDSPERVVEGVDALEGPSHSELAIADGRSLSLLLVEDVAINRQVLTGLLENAGHLVFTAEDGRGALALCRQQGFDVILMDMHLPGMSGAEVSRCIRGEAGKPASPDKLNAATPIVALTASVAPEDIRHYLDSGMDAVVAKPIRLERLRQVLAEVLNAPVVPVEAEAAVPASAGTVNTRLLATHAGVFGRSRLLALLAQMVEQAGDLRAQLAEMLRTGDLYEAEGIAHKLAGSCELLGLDASGRSLRVMEKTAAADDLAACRDEWQSFGAVFECELATAREFAAAIRPG